MEGGGELGGRNAGSATERTKKSGKSTNYQVSGKRKESGVCVPNERKGGVGVAGVRGWGGEEQDGREGEERGGGEKAKDWNP